MINYLYRQLKNILYVTGALCVLCASSFAATIKIVAPETAEVDQSFSLEIHVEDVQGQVSDPKLPSLPNFSVYSSGRMQNITFINNKLSSSTIYKYTLVPRFAGVAVIEPINIAVDGTLYTTERFEIKVSGSSSSSSGQHRQRTTTYSTNPSQQQQQTQPAQQGASNRQQPRQTQQQRRQAKQSQQPSGDTPTSFIRATVNKQTAFVGEQISLTIRFYTSVPIMSAPQYSPPATADFLVQDIASNRTGETEIDGVNYLYSEVKLALFALTPGKKTIGPALVEYVERQERSLDPFSPDFMKNFLGGTSGVRKTARTTPLTVNIKPLPGAGKPEDFTGAVGTFKLTADVDNKTPKVGETVNLNITISGRGDLSTLLDPKLPEVNELKFYDMAGALNVNKDNDIVQGSKVYTAVLSPKVTGEIVIPSIKYSYFDPLVSRYHTLTTDPITINAQPGDFTSANTVSYGTQPVVGAQVQALTNDILYIKPIKTPVFSAALTKTADSPLTKIALLILAAAALIIKLSSKINLKVLVTKKSPYAKAKAQIKNAQALFKDKKQKEAIAKLDEILKDYLRSKLKNNGRDISATKKLVAAIKDAYPSAKDASLEQISETCEELDRLRFAPISVDAETSLTDRMLELIDTLEKELK